MPRYWLFKSEPHSYQARNTMIEHPAAVRPQMRAEPRLAGMLLL